MFQVNAVFVNIFGGIVRCDEIARGIIAAAQEINITVPIVVRLQGMMFTCTLMYRYMRIESTLYMCVYMCMLTNLASPSLSYMYMYMYTCTYTCMIYIAD